MGEVSPGASTSLISMGWVLGLGFFATSVFWGFFCLSEIY